MSWPTKPSRRRRRTCSRVWLTSSTLLPHRRRKWASSRLRSSSHAYGKKTVRADIWRRDSFSTGLAHLMWLAVLVSCSWNFHSGVSRKCVLWQMSLVFLFGILTLSNDVLERSTFSVVASVFLCFLPLKLPLISEMNWLTLLSISRKLFMWTNNQSSVGPRLVSCLLSGPSLSPHISLFGFHMQICYNISLHGLGNYHSVISRWSYLRLKFFVSEEEITGVTNHSWCEELHLLFMF